MTKAEPVFNSSVKSLAPAERLGLARMILDDLTDAGWDSVTTEWSDKDMKDFRASSMRYTEGQYPEPEAGV